MYEMVTDLRDDWCSNVYRPAPTLDAAGNKEDNTSVALVRGDDGTHLLHVNCTSLIEVAIKEPNKIISWCPGRVGSIGDGVVVEEG